MEEMITELELKSLKEILPVININDEEIKKMLEDRLAVYKMMVVTEESYKADKAEAKKLAGLRTRIDAFRKEKKKEMSLPITEFEKTCNELVGIVKEAEQPLLEGIAVFDEKQREKCKEYAELEIKKAAEKFGLRQEYAVKMKVKDSYLLLSGTKKAVREDVESVAMELRGKQDERDMYLSNVQTAIDQANVGIKTKLTMDEFAYYTDNNMELTAIIKKISDQAAKIAEAEKPKPEPVPEPVIEPETVPVSMVEEKPEVKEQQPENDTVINPVLEKVESQYIVTFTAKASRSKMEALCKYLKENSIFFKTISQQKVNN